MVAGESIRTLAMDNFYIFNFNVLRGLYKVCEVSLVSQRGTIILIVLVTFEINPKSVYGGN